jgi:hypothetical protein
MLLARWVLLMLLLVAGLCFAVFAATGQQRYRRWGLIILKWVLIAAFMFFGILILERVA